MCELISLPLKTKAVEELQKLLDEATSSYTNLTEQFTKQAAEVNAEIESKQVNNLPQNFGRRLLQYFDTYNYKRK